jgi:hypothetical protein
VLGTLNDIHIRQAATTENAQHSTGKTKTQGGELQWKMMKFGVHSIDIGPLPIKATMKLNMKFTMKMLFSNTPIRGTHPQSP